MWVLLDVAKAFNSLVPFELFRSLMDTELDDKCLMAIFNLTTNNEYFVRVGASKYISSNFKLTTGSNQGSSISTILWD